MLSKLTIFKKMLIIPGLAFICFSVYMIYVYYQQEKSRLYLLQLQSAHFPAIELSSENLILFDQVMRTFKDAVGANEADWLDKTKRPYSKIKNNLIQLHKFKKIHTTTSINELQQGLEKYYELSLELSKRLINKDQDFEKIEQLISLMPSTLKETQEIFKGYHQQQRQAFALTITITETQQQKVLNSGFVVGFISLSLMLSITFIIAFGTRRSILDILKSITNIADGKPDFRQRLEERNHDEIGMLVKQFNRFTTKLEQDHNELILAKQFVEDSRQVLAEKNLQTQESIEYALLIQNELIPADKQLHTYFNDAFAYWQPKDIVGGDIYLFEEINANECLIMQIDCIGHGVSGAFVAMLVTAIEKQIVAKINASSLGYSPALILKMFNQEMKKIFQQERGSEFNHSGFDGVVVYYNKQTQMIKFSGAKTAIFYTDDNEIKTLKGSLSSVGYQNCNPDYEFKEKTLELKKGTRLYLTSDGYLDQCGGEKAFAFGKRRFLKLLNSLQSQSMTQQKEALIEALINYQGKQIRRDDITLIGLEV